MFLTQPSLFKCLFLLWCMSPLEGSTLIYTKLIRPYFLKHESKIDSIVKKGTDGISKFADSAMEKGEDLGNLLSYRTSL